MDAVTKPGAAEVAGSEISPPATSAVSGGNTGRFVAVPAGSQRTVDRPVRMRRVVLPVAAAAIVVALGVGIGGSLVSRRIAEQQAVHDVAQLTDVLAEAIVQPALTDQMPSDTALASSVLDPLVRARVLNDSLIRVKVWTPSGKVLYSDEARLIGDTFPLEDEARAAFTKPRLEADVSDLRRPENRFERNRGKLLEVYRPVWTPNGQALMFETYFRYDTVTSRSHELWRGFAGVMVSSLAALLVLLIPLVWALLARARRARLQREQLMRRALDASDDERRRIAATLHDGVVQQLAAASFTAAGQADRAAASGDESLAAGLRTVAGTVRDSIAGLRSLLVDIYPPSLHTSGLAVALRDLARSANGTDTEIVVDVDAQVADSLPAAAQEATFRVAQEALRNAIRHSGGTRVSLRLGAVDEDWAALDVVDNGHGFDAPAAFGRDEGGHFGLQLMADAARRTAAGLAFAPAPGGGSHLRLEVART
ncbi:MAG: two-component system, NarL family, sensor kinase [Pseudonocardiales bacterium]|nr:two-component system, NarL family, sensor kinase [Pseudonocardiales bacterium]